MGEESYLQGGSKKKIFPTTKDLLADIPHVSKGFLRTHGSPPIDHLAGSRPSWFGGFSLGAQNADRVASNTPPLQPGATV